MGRLPLSYEIFSQCHDLILRDTLTYLPPFYNLQHGMIYGNTVHAYHPYMHVDQHVARGDGPIIGLEKACRS